MMNPNKPLFHLETWIGFWFWYLLVCFGIGYLIGVSLK